MIPQAGRSIISSLGPITRATGTPSASALAASGVVNQTIGTTPVKLLSGGSTKGIVRKCRLCAPAAGNIAFAAVVKNDTAPTITAVGDGTATDGPILVGGGGIVAEFDLSDHLDLYVVASAAATPVQLWVEER